MPMIHQSNYQLSSSTPGQSLLCTLYIHGYYFNLVGSSEPRLQPSTKVSPAKEISNHANNLGTNRKRAYRYSKYNYLLKSKSYKIKNIFIQGATTSARQRNPPRPDPTIQTFHTLASPVRHTRSTRTAAGVDYFYTVDAEHLLVSSPRKAAQIIQPRAQDHDQDHDQDHELESHHPANSAQPSK